MFYITIKNMLKDKLVTLSLIIGILLSIAIVSSIPIYTSGILNKLLQDNFIKYEAGAKNADKSNTEDSTKKDSNAKVESEKDLLLKKEYPSVFSATYTTTKMNETYSNFYKEFKESETYIYGTTSKVKAPFYAQKTTLSLPDICFDYKTKSNQTETMKNTIVSVSDIMKHIKITQGKTPSNEFGTDKVLEVIVDESTFNNFNMKIDNVYTLIAYNNNNSFKIKIVGIFKPNNDKYWADKDTDFYCKLVVTQEAFLNVLKANEYYFKNFIKVNYKVIYDYEHFEYKNVDDIYKDLSSFRGVLEKRKANIKVASPIEANLEKFIKNEGLYRTLIWIFAMPILIIMLFYIYVIAGFLVDSDKEQIAVLKSRGISFFEILRIYFYEGIMLCSLGFILGPILGLFISNGLSYISGFLDFDLGLHIAKFSLSFQSYIYSLGAAVLMLIVLLFSVYTASKNTIVQAKRTKRRNFASILNIKNLDIIFIGIALYGYFVYSKYKNVSMFSKSNEVPVDPLLYLISTIFIIGFGMLLLRIYKYFVMLMQFIAKRYMSTPYYLGITNVLRYHLSKGVILLFIIMTIALGLFDIKIAKNINSSTENTVKYAAGADLIIQQNWGKTIDENYKDLDGEQYDERGKLYIYSEPPYAEISKVNGVESYTKVLNTYEGWIKNDNTLVKSSVMGIIPNEFGKIAWFDSNLLKFHWYHYLNALTKNPKYILISSGLSKSAGFHKGDTIVYRLENGLSVSGIVLDVIDYWPGCVDLQNKNQIIGNFNYIFSKASKYPYELWIKKATGISNKSLYDSMNSKQLNIVGYKDMSTELYNSKKDIFLKGTNAVLSLGLIAVTVVTVMGFILYWIKALKSRKLSFGVYRSLGISKGKIYLIIIFEQIFTLGFSIFLGIINGIVTCKIFLPLVTALWYNNRYVLPVKRISYFEEYLNFGSVLIGIFLISMFILGKYISKLKINEAIKLGEE